MSPRSTAAAPAIPLPTALTARAVRLRSNTSVTVVRWVEEPTDCSVSWAYSRSGHDPSWMPRVAYQLRTPWPGSGRVDSSTWTAAQEPEAARPARALDQPATRD